MTTLEKENNNNNEQQTPKTDARKIAEEALKKLKEQQEDDLPWITKPMMGEHRVVWIDASKYIEDFQDNKFAPKTEDDPNPQRKVYIFTVKTKKDLEKTLTLEPGQAMEVFNILSRKDGGCSWIDISRIGTKKGGTKLDFLAL
jgi:hypothetical protein